MRNASRSRSFVFVVRADRRFSALRLDFSVLDLLLAVSDTASRVLLALACTAIGEFMSANDSTPGLRSDSVLLTLCASNDPR
jgi:hypothetical protein